MIGDDHAVEYEYRHLLLRDEREGGAGVEGLDLRCHWWSHSVLVDLSGLIVRKRENQIFSIIDYRNSLERKNEEEEDLVIYPPLVNIVFLRIILRSLFVCSWKPVCWIVWRSWGSWSALPETIWEFVCQVYVFFLSFHGLGRLLQQWCAQHLLEAVSELYSRRSYAIREFLMDS